MAKVKIQGHASGTGILTVTAPNTSTDRTITLPDATGTLATTTGTTGIQNAAADSDTIWIDANENVGISQAPAAWRSQQTAIDIGDCSAITSHTSNLTYIAHNWYDDGTDKYKTTDEAAAIELSHNGEIQFKQAASGSADAAISWATNLSLMVDGRGVSQFTAKAWINFNGQISTPSIYDSHNVSSITDNGTAQYTINFSNNMANANYCAVAHAHAGGGINDTNVVQMPASGRAVGSVGCHVMSALNDATAFDTDTDSEVTEILIFGD